MTKVRWYAIDKSTPLESNKSLGLSPTEKATLDQFHSIKSRIYFELVASFANRLNLLKYGEKMHAYAANLPLERTSKRGSDHAHSIRHAASACRVFF